MTDKVTVPRETWDAMREAHQRLIRAYINLLESGRDRIVSLGGTCDPVDQMEAGDPALREAKEALTAANAVSEQPTKLDEIEQYRLQMAAISTAAIGYWKEGDDIHPDFDTVALRDVTKLYAKYDRLYTAVQPHPQATEPAGKTRDPLDLGQYVNEANISANDKPVAVIEKLQAVINVKKGFQ